MSTKSSRFQPADGSDKTPAATRVLCVQVDREQECRLVSNRAGQDSEPAARAVGESRTHLRVDSTILLLISFTSPFGYSTCFNQASTSSLGYSHVFSTNAFELDSRATGASNAWIEVLNSERNFCSWVCCGEEGERVEGVATIAQLCHGVGTLPMKRTSFK